MTKDTAPLGLREQLARGHRVRADVREPIRSSWCRSWQAGLDPGEFSVPYVGAHGRSDGLVRAAAPVLGHMSEELSSAALSVVLTDPAGAVLRRWVPETKLLDRLDEIQLAPGFDYAENAIGTNAIGTALAARRPSIVRGDEHFADELTNMACAAAPILDRRRSGLLGVVDVTSRAADANPMMLTVVRQAAAEIQREMVRAEAPEHRRLHERFGKLKRGARAPIALVGPGVTFANATAARFLDDAAGAEIWLAVEDAARAGAPSVSGELVLDGTRIGWRAEPERDGADVRSALVRFDRDRSLDPSDPLTDAERSVASLVSEGMSNREVADRLFVSPHTVDAHLRHIFSKLGISSRVQLAVWWQQSR